MKKFTQEMRLGAVLLTIEAAKVQTSTLFNQAQDPQELALYDECYEMMRQVRLRLEAHLDKKLKDDTRTN